MSCQTVRFLGAPSSRNVIHNFNGKLNEKKVTENELKADSVQITFPKETCVLSIPQPGLHDWRRQLQRWRRTFYLVKFLPKTAWN